MKPDETAAPVEAEVQPQFESTGTLAECLGILAPWNPHIMVEVSGGESPLLCNPQDIKLTNPKSMITLNSQAQIILDRRFGVDGAAIGEIAIKVSAVLKRNPAPFSIGLVGNGQLDEVIATSVHVHWRLIWKS